MNHREQTPVSSTGVEMTGAEQTGMDGSRESVCWREGHYAGRLPLRWGRRKLVAVRCKVCGLWVRL